MKNYNWNKNQNSILAILRNGPHLGTQELSNLTGCDDRSIRRALASLRRQGLIKSYSAPKGRGFKTLHVLEDKSNGS